MSSQTSTVTRYLIGIAFGVALTLLVLYAYSALTKSIGSNDSMKAFAGQSSIGSVANKSTAPNGSIVGFGRDLPQLPQYSSEFDRSVALYSLLEQSGRLELIDLIGQAKEIDHSARRTSTLVAIGQNLAAIDPIMALEDVLEFPTSMRIALLTGFYQEWSMTNLDDAKASLQTLDKPSKDAALQAILETRSELSDSQLLKIAGQFGREEFVYGLITKKIAPSRTDSPEDVWNALLEDEIEDVYQLRELQEVSLAWARRNGVSVLSKIFTALDSPEDSWMRTELINDVVELDAQEAFNYVKRLPTEARNTLMSSVVRVWAKSQPEDAFKAAADIRPVPEARNLLSDVIGVWASNDPHGILAVLEQFDAETRSDAAEQAISTIARNNAAQAVKTLEEIQTFVANKSGIEFALIYPWSESDPRAALDWLLEDSQRGGTRRNSMVAKTIRELTHEDPQYAFQIGLQQPLVWKNASGMESDVILELTKFDIETAISLLSKVREESIVISHVWIGSALVGQRDPQRALELGAQVPESSRDFYYETITDDWAESNPHQLFDEIDRMANPRLKSSMARALIFNQPSNPVLTKDQIEHAKSLLIERDAERVAYWEQLQ